MVENPEKFTFETITSITPWVPGKLFSFTCTRPAGFRFTAGQFARLGLPNTLGFANEADWIWRAYSMVSGPYDEYLEFFSIKVPDGAFTSHLSSLRVGDSIGVDKTSVGFLTTARFESGSDLWMLASGTGLAPFLSMLHDPSTWEQFQQIYLVYSARTALELAYQDRLRALSQHPVLGTLVEDLANRFHFVPVVTREHIEGCLHQRINQLLENGTLAGLAQGGLSLEKSRFMVCGNPEMVADTRAVLKQLGFSTARRNSPGQIAVENYW